MIPNYTKMEKILDEFVKICKRKFGDDLFSIILFGSRARGLATEYSDFDLLVVLRNLDQYANHPLRDLRLKSQMKYGVRIDLLLISEEDFEANTTLPSPLFSTLSLGFRIIYDGENMIKALRSMFSRISKENIVYYEGGKKWDLSKRSSKILQ